MSTTIRAASPLLACVLALTACVAGIKKKPAPVPAEQQPKAAENVEKAYVPPADMTEASLRGKFQQIPELETIHFDYDSSTLGEDALTTLKQNAAFLREHPQDVRVAGYCDERGTVEYNLALGQKRAKEVRDYYIRLGVPGQSVATISYGKENPVCRQSTEDCWAQNRRAETMVRARPQTEAAGGEAK